MDYDFDQFVRIIYQFVRKSDKFVRNSDRFVRDYGKFDRLAVQVRPLVRRL